MKITKLELNTLHGHMLMEGISFKSFLNTLQRHNTVYMFLGGAHKCQTNCIITVIGLIVTIQPFSAIRCAPIVIFNYYFMNQITSLKENNNNNDTCDQHYMYY